ncbi:MAG: RNA chaperone Hfq [Clostridiales bacterium]|nr:RNA chaperone Hfq [Clostridiales bacterium]
MNEQNNSRNIQDAFLNQARKNAIPVDIHITNGYLISGAKIVSFDNYAIIVEAGGKQMLVYKHAVSTVTPQSALEL